MSDPSLTSRADSRNDRKIELVITETLRYSRVYTEEDLSDVTRVPLSLIRKMPDQDLVELMDHNDRIEEDMGRHGDVIGGEWAFKVTP